MKLIFCLSYLNIPRTITLADGNFIIATQDRNIYKFLQEIYDADRLIYIETFKFSLAHPLVSAHKFLSLRKKILNLVKSHCKSEVYFFLVSSSPSMAYAIKLLSKRAILYYEPAALLELKDVARPPLPVVIQKYKLRIIYGLEVSIKKVGDRFILPYAKSFFQETKSKYVTTPLDSELIRTAMARSKSGNSSARCIIFVGGEVEHGLVGEEELEAIVEEVVNAIGAENVAIKMRPGHHECRTFNKAIKTIENSVPGNLLIYQHRIVIGFHTALLFEAANSGCVSISLMDLLSQEDKRATEDYKKYLISNLDDGCQIRFPKNLQEFCDAIK